MGTFNSDAVWWRLDYARAATDVAIGIAKVNVVPPPSMPSAPPTTKKETRERPSSGRYVASRPAAIFASGRPPEAGGSIFGDDLISEIERFLREGGQQGGSGRPN